MKYVTIDFETANGNLTSACSVGLVICNNGKIIDQKYYLINPNEPFNNGNILIHGITPDMVCNAPYFYEIWDEIYDILNGNIVFAHAASFDISVLKALIEKYNLKCPDIKVGCTLKLSRLAFKDVLTSFKLSTLSSYLEIEHNHHNAISDALVCFYIIERAKRMYQVYDVFDLFEEVGLCFGYLREPNSSVSNNSKNIDFRNISSRYIEYRSVYSRINNKKKVNKLSNKLDGIVLSFTGKPVKMTKTEFKKVVLENGGLYSKEVNRVINTFVIFQNPNKAHLNALERLKEVKEIKIYTEEEFMRLIYG